MQVIARRSQASCQSFLTVRRVTRVEARRSTAQVLTRTDSTHSRLSEVPRLTWSGRQASTAIAAASAAVRCGVAVLSVVVCCGGGTMRTEHALGMGDGVEGNIDNRSG